VTRQAREAREARTAKQTVKAAHSKRRRGRKQGEHAAKVTAALAAIPSPGGVAEQFEPIVAGPVRPVALHASLASSITYSLQFTH
jgi:hypothetical protein